MKFLIFISIILFSCKENKKYNSKKNFKVYDTVYNKNGSFVITKFNSDKKVVMETMFDSLSNKIRCALKTETGILEIKYNLNEDEINEYVYPDSSSKLKLNNRYLISNGDTLYNRSKFFRFDNFNEIIDTSTSLNINFFINTGFNKKSKIIVEGRLKLINNLDYFRVLDFVEINNTFKLKIGKLKKGKYKLYGAFNVDKIKGMNNQIDSSETFYINKEIIVK